MKDTGISFNGVDPEGIELPDEIFWDAKSGWSLELCRINTHDDWELRIYDRQANLVERNQFETFEPAFAAFAGAIQNYMVKP